MFVYIPEYAVEYPYINYVLCYGHCTNGSSKNKAGNSHHVYVIFCP